MKSFSFKDARTMSPPTATISASRYGRGCLIGLVVFLIVTVAGCSGEADRYAKEDRAAEAEATTAGGQAPRSPEPAAATVASAASKPVTSSRLRGSGEGGAIAMGSTGKFDEPATGDAPRQEPVADDLSDNMAPALRPSMDKADPSAANRPNNKTNAPEGYRQQFKDGKAEKKESERGDGWGKDGRDEYAKQSSGKKSVPLSDAAAMPRGKSKRTKLKRLAERRLLLNADGDRDQLRDRSKAEATDEEEGESEELEEDDSDEDSSPEEGQKAALTAKPRLHSDLGLRHSRVDSTSVAPLPGLFQRPATLLPRMFYFEPTYLGGNAGIAERLRRLRAHLPDAESRIVESARSHQQDFDTPDAAGIALTARLATPWVDRPQRVLLQVGLQGSRRFGWRRPPLDVVLLLDAPFMRGSLRAARGLIRAAIARLGPQDRVGIVTVGAGGNPRVVAPVQRLRDLELGLERHLEGLRADGQGGPGRALSVAGDLLQAASAEEAQIPGTQTVWLLTAGSHAQRVSAASAAADALTRRGIVTSVIEVGATPNTAGAWWRVASSGHGNYHRPAAAETASAFDTELESLSKVVARLLRVNVRLAKGVGAIRVIGSRVLDPDEVIRLKAREKAVDTALSKTLGVKADRGDDDDGVQTNIPYFYGGDAHVILIELWVEGPGEVADITIKYKDMVNLKNATARVSVAMPGTPRTATGLAGVARNYAGFELAETLIKAGYKVRHGQLNAAGLLLDAALPRATTSRETNIIRGFRTWLQRVRSNGRTAGLSEALILAGKRQIGQSPQLAQAATPGQRQGR